MSLRITTDPNACDQSQWEKFVRDHPNGCVFQTPQMYAVYCASRNCHPVFVACHDHNSLVGILLAVIQREYSGWLGVLSGRSIIWGGPLIKNDNQGVLDAIIQGYDRIAKKQVLYTQIRNMFPADSMKEKFAKYGYNSEDHLDILIDLTKPAEMLWKELHPTRKKQIERGYRRGAELFFYQNPDDIDISECYDLITKLYKRIRLPLPCREYFLNSKKFLNGHISLFLLRHKEKIIGCRFVLLYKKTIYDWYAGSREDALDKYPNDILPWEVIKWGAQNGYKIFQFGGAGKPGVHYGVRDYKMKFGGQLVNYGRFQKVHRPLVLKIAKTGFKVWQIVKR